MKTPRIHDFDPKAAERQLGTPLDGMPTIQKPVANNHAPAALSEKTPAKEHVAHLPTGRSTDEPTGRRTDRPVGRRIPVRRGFEFYEDQLVTLKKLSLQEQMDGKPGSMSQMVREALDDYLKKRTKESL